VNGEEHLNQITIGASFYFSDIPFVFFQSEKETHKDSERQSAKKATPWGRISVEGRYL